MNQRLALLAVVMIFILPVRNSVGAEASADLPAPRVDHHQHLLSPKGAALLNTPELSTNLPPVVKTLLATHEAKWNNADSLASLYADHAVAYDANENTWVQGRVPVAEHLAKRFVRPYRILPLSWHADGDNGYLAALYSRGEGAERRNVGSVAMHLVRVAGVWHIAMEFPVFPGPVLEEPLDAERLVTLLDAAGIRRAVVLSTAYWYQSPHFKVDDPVASAREENAWTASQVARYSDRLVGFCSLNPISDAALDLLRECVKDGRFKGLKLHLGNADVNLTNADHLRRVREVFAAANAARLAIVIHARGSGDYDARHARILVKELLPVAPDIPVQMAHLWGGGAYAPEALAVYAEAVEKGDPATQRFIFDASDAAFVGSAPGTPLLLAQRMRQIGLDRIYYGSDAAFDGHPDARASWKAFREGIPLTDAEFSQIAANVAPYLQH